MIIGSGDISSVLVDRNDVTFFASGVSDSSCTDPVKFEREKSLLLEQPRHIHLVYFSSLCVYTSKTVYANHKRVMENLVRNTFASCTIVRLGNIDWGENPHTLLNYLCNHPEAPVLHVYRHIVSKGEFLYWMNLIPVGKRNEMNIPGKMWFVPDLVDMIRLNDRKHVSA